MILPRHKLVDLVICKVISEKIVVDGRTHQYDSDFGVVSHDSFDGEKNEISVDVPFMYFIKDYKGVLVEEICAVHKSL